ncbi:prenyltransferase [Microlunatus speluncae]|uniref:prenyltransferase n=1 Tax=Microlunatus speluncae TaxID=2594267 RepID=UPI0012667913|nr:prenyltransferase [Microlunatus speluncae]
MSPSGDAGRRGRSLRPLDVLLMARPQFWLLSVAAMQPGFVLATHRILPRGPELLIMGYAFLVAGPLLWLSALAINDAYDLQGDLANPRKAGSPLVRRHVSPRGALRIGVVAGVVAVLAAVPLGSLFALGTALTVLLGWAYSAPPLRLKARPGADVAVNAIPVGVLGPLGGWVAITGSPAGFPWPITVVATMAVAALYLVTTIVDLETDRAVGVRTTAVALGRRAAAEVGFALWAGSALLTLGLAIAGIVVQPSLIPLHLVIMPVLFVLYRVLVIRRQPTFRAVTVLAAAYLLPCLAFVINYVDSI